MTNYLFINRLILALVSTVIITSCGPEVIFDQNIEIKTPWEYNDHYTYTFNVLDTTKAYDLHLVVNHNESFGYENAYVKVQTIFPDQKKVEQALSLQLAGNNGVWLGDCNNEKCEVDILLASKAYYKLKGKYIITISQHSRLEKLEGINSLKLKIHHAE